MSASYLFEVKATSPRALLLIALIASLTWVVSQIIYALFLSPTRNIPGPLLARFTRLWELFNVLKGNSHWTDVELHEKYGPVIRLAPNRFSFNEPEDIQVIYALGSKFPKSEYYEGAGIPGIYNVFSTRNIADHSDRRRKVANMYSMSTLTAYEHAVDKMTNVLLRKFDSFAKTRKLFNIPSFTTYYAFDVIGEMTVGEDFGMLDAEAELDMMANLAAAITYMSRIGLFPEFHLPFVRLGNVLNLKNPGNALVDYTVSQVEKHRYDGPKGKTDPRGESFLQKVLKLEAAHKLDKSNYNDVIGANIAAGADTTGITMSAIIYYVYRNPPVLAKLRDELGDAETDGRISDPLTFAEAQALPYLQAVIKEGLRMHPAVGALLARNVPKGGVTLAGHYFKEGTQVGTNAWTLHRNERVFGADARAFRPERWLENDGDASLRESMNFAFGAGSRVCIGKNISLLEMSKVIPLIVRNYDFKFEHPEKLWDEYCAWFVKPNYKCWVEKRQ